MLFRPVVLALFVGAAACTTDAPPADLPVAIQQKLVHDLDAARRHPHHVWRDVAATNADGTVNAYVEIGLGDSRKWELNIARQQRVIDRVLPAELGGYPINYGFVPGTISYDGDPFDELVLGPSIDGGSLVKGVAVGIMHMVDDKGWDSKVIISPTDGSGAPRYRLGPDTTAGLERFFNTYKRWEGKYSRVTGWGDAAEGLRFVARTAGFFRRGADPTPWDQRPEARGR
jgi:inorganic pyrophosphatase